MAVWGRAAVSATQPTAGPETVNGFFSTAAETCLTAAIDRIGDNADSLRPISASVSSGTR